MYVPSIVCALRSLSPIEETHLKKIYLFIHERHTHRERETEAKTQAEGEAGSM